MNIVALYLYLVNITALIMITLDKYFAIKHLRRISEFTFFVMSLIGGGLGIIIGCNTVAHKTQKKLFNSFIPKVTAAEAVIFGLLFVFIGV